MPVKELDRATQLADALRASALCDTAAAALAEAKDLRCRAFTLLGLAYAEVRRAVAYLRAHKGDAESIAPSLYPGRPGRRAPRPKEPHAQGDAVIIATFNVENLFERPARDELSDVDCGQPAIDAAGELNALINKRVYGPATSVACCSY